MKKNYVVLCLSFLITSCVFFSTDEKKGIEVLRKQNITIDNPIGNYQPRKSALYAGLLNIIPGAGNIYLAIGTDEELQYIYGTVNLGVSLFFTGPITWFWCIPQAVIDANSINKKELFNYYKNDPLGIIEFERENLTWNLADTRFMTNEFGE